MPFTPSQYALVSLILFASSVLQGAVGFASGLFGIPLLMRAGLTLPSALAISLVAAAIQNVVALWELRSDIDFPATLRPSLIRLAMMPLGVYALYLIGEENKDTANQLVGLIVLGIVALQFVTNVPPQPRLHPIWEWLAFGLGGFLLGLCGMGGPPMVLWVLAHDWTMNRARGFLYFIFVSGIVPQALLLWYVFGHSILVAMFLGLTVLPSVLAGLWLGLYLSRLISDRLLRRLCIALLIAIALWSLASPYLG